MATGVAERAFLFGSKVATRAFWSVSSRVAGGSVISDLHVRATEEAPGEYVRAVGPARIEPQCGYVIADPACLVESSLYPNFQPHQPLWRLAGASPLGYLNSRRRQARGRRFARVVSLRHFWEWNYYHFYFDVLGKLRLLEDAGIDRSVPLVLGGSARDLPWAKQILQSGRLRERTWVVPEDDEYVAADEVVFCRTQQDYKKKMDHVLDEMGVSGTIPRRDDRIFLGRADARNRRITNFGEVWPVLERHGFRHVEAVGKLSIADQIELFSNTRHLVAVHGAGITNTLFRRDRPMAVLELHASSYITTDFRRMCRELSHYYDTLGGEPGPGQPMHADFALSPGALEAKLERMLAS